MEFLFSNPPLSFTDSADSGDMSNSGYEPPQAIRSQLVSLPANTEAILVRDSNMMLDRGNVLRYCGSGGVLGVGLDASNQQDEISEENNKAFIDFTVQGCPGNYDISTRSE